jgi:hypothetical protein
VMELPSPGRLEAGAIVCAPPEPILKMICK